MHVTLGSSAVVGRMSCGDVLMLVDGFVGSIANVSEASLAVALFGTHATEVDPPGVDQTWQKPEQGQSYADKQVAAAAGEEGHGRWGEEEGNNHQKDIRSLYSHLE